MPTYQYRCTKCEYEFEEFQLISAAPTDKCPECGGKPERIISGGAGLLFKGSGFYITDYRSDGYKKAAEADTKPSSISKPTESKKSDSKKKKG